MKPSRRTSEPRRPWLTLIAALCLIAALTPPSPARGPIREVSASTVADNKRVKHPGTLQQVLQIERDHAEDSLSLSLLYWRTSQKKADAGRVLVDVEIQRRGSDSSLVVGRFEDRGAVSSRKFGRGWGPLPALLEGDLIVVTFRFRDMTRIRPAEGVYAEAVLYELNP